MFIFAKNTKEIVVTAGVAIACLTLIGLAAVYGYRDAGFGRVIAVIFVLIALAICKGIKLGYTAGRALSCIFIVATGTFAVLPFTYDDFLGNTDEYWAFLLRTALFVAIGCIAFFSLGEHAKMRGIKLAS